MDRHDGQADPGVPLPAPSTSGPRGTPSGEARPPEGSGLDHSPAAHRRRPPRASRTLPPDRLGGWLRRRGPTYAVIALGGFAGGNARYALGLVWPEQPGAFPWTTFGINVSGAFVLALLLVLILEAWQAPTWLRPLAATGFLGAFTTFSSVVFALDRFAATGQWLLFCAYMVFSVLAGLAAASFGILMGRSWVAARTRRSVPDVTDEPSAAPRGGAPTARAAGPATSSDASTP